jgi:anaerobic magnesium-protoporphyrin IX monomethyl ester cyclase
VNGRTRVHGRVRSQVALYQPAVEHFTMPLGLISVASTLTDVDVRVFDGRIDRRVPELTRPLLLGVSVVSGAPIADALRFSREFRARYPGVPVVWGGWHASILPDQVAAHEAIDVAVIGQGQATFAEVVAAALAGRPMAGIPGTVVKVGGELVRGPVRPMSSPDAFPRPRYELLDAPRYFAGTGRRGFDYASSQGCPFRCAFCSDPMVYGRSWHGIPAERVLAELDELIVGYDADAVWFQDDLFFVNKTRALAIMEGLARRSRPVRWVATLRAQHIVKLTEDELALLARSGCGRVTVGAESGSDATLARLNKDQRADDLLVAAERLGKYGITASFSFIAGTPGEPPEELSRTLDRILAIKQRNPRIDTPLFRFTPYPGSDLVAELERRGAPLPTTLEEWARCDFYASKVADLTEEQTRLVERFAFYAKIGWAPDRGVARRFLARIARARLNRRMFALPVEMHAAKALRRS